MKGYRMVLLVNAALFLLFGLLTYTYGLALRPEPGCDTDACQQGHDAYATTQRVAPLLALVGLILLALGLILGRPKAPQP